MPLGSTTLRDWDGNVVSVPAEKAQELLDRGYTPETDVQRAERTTAAVKEDLYGGVDGAIKAGAAGLLSGLTVGASDVVGAALGGRQRLKGLQEENPGVAITSNIAGAVLPAIVTAGASAPGSAAGIGARILARSPAALASRAGIAVGEAAVGGGAGLGARVAAGALGAGVEGAIQGGGQYLSQVALEDKPLSAEGFVAGMGTGALFAAPIGGAFTAGARALTRARALFPKAEVTAKAAQGVKQEAVSEIVTAVSDGEAMAAAAARRLAMAEAKTGMAEAGERTTRRLFGASDPAALGDQVAAGAEAAQLKEALQGYQASKAQLDDWIRSQADLDDVLAGLQAPEVQVGAPTSYRRPSWALDEAPGAARPRPLDEADLGRLAEGTPTPSREAATAVGRRPGAIAEGTPAGADREIAQALGMPTAVGRKAPAELLSGVAAPAGAVAGAPGGGSLESLLAGTKQQLDAGRSLSEIGGASPLRKAYVTGKELDTGRPLTQKPTPVEAKAEAQALFQWQNGRGAEINDYARSGKLGEGSFFDSPEQAKETLDAIDRAIARGATDADQVVFRGIGTGSRGAARGIKGELKVGSIIEDPGYSATTTDRLVGLRYANKGGTSSMLEIELPKGSKHARLDDDDLGESEILLPRGSKFEILSVRNETIDGRTVRVGRARLVVDKAPTAAAPTEFSVNHKFLGETPLRLATETRDVGGGKITTVRVTHNDGTFVGEAKFTHQGGKLLPDEATVDGPWQRLGIGTKMYESAEATTGLKVAPGKRQTEAGEAFSRKFREARGGAPSGGRPSEITDEAFGKISDGIPRPEFDAVLQGVEDGSILKINGRLRNGVRIDDLSEAERVTLGNLDHAMDTASLPRDATLYRGIKDPQAVGIPAGLKVGDTYSDGGFSWVTHQRAVANEYANQVASKPGLLLEIETPKGFPAVPYKTSGGDPEILLPRGTQYTVTEIRDGGNVIRVVAQRPDDLARIPGHNEIRALAKEAPDAVIKRVESNIGNMSLDDIGRAEIDILSASGDMDAATWKRSKELREALNRRRIDIEDGRIKVRSPVQDELPAETGLERIARAQRGVADEIAQDLPAETGLERLARAQRGALTEAERIPAQIDDSGELEALLRGTKQGLDSGQSLRDVALGLEPPRPSSVPDDLGQQIVERELGPQITRVLGKRSGNNVDMGPELARAAKVIGDHEASLANLADALGPDAPTSATSRAGKYREATRAQADSMASSAAKAADDLSARGPGTTVVDDEIAKALQQADMRAGRAPAPADRTVVDPMPMGRMPPAPTDRTAVDSEITRALRQAEMRAPAPAAPVASPAPPARGRLGLLADVGTALEVLQTMGVGVPDIDKIPIIGPVLSVYLKARAVMGILGRKGGSIGRSAESLVASKGAAARDRMAAATTKILEGTAKAAKAGARAAGPAALLATKLFPGGAEPKPNDPYALYDARTDEISRALQPGAISRAVDDRILTADAELQQAITGQVERGLKFLESKRPKQTVLPGMLPGDGDYKPSRSALEVWGRYIKAVNDPISVLEDLALGQATIEGAETLRTVYPRLFQEAQRLLLEAAPKMQKTLPYARRVAISIMYQVPIDSTMTPQHLQFLTAPGPGAAAAGPAPAAPGAPAILGPLQAGQQTMPSLDRRAGM